MNHVPHRPGRRRHGLHRRRGATLLFFMLIAIPFFFFSLAMVADIVRLIDGHRQASYVAANAATAGAFQFVNERVRLDSSTAITVAAATARKAVDAQVMRHAVDVDVAPPQVQTVSGSPRRVQVTVSYRLDGLLIMQYFVGDDRDRLTVTRSAEVCQAGDSVSRDATLGYCARPRARG